MAISYDHPNQQINVPVSDANPLTVETLRTSIRAEEASERGIIYKQIARASGLDNLSATVTTGLTLELINNWQVLFTGSGDVTVQDGNLIGGISGDVFATAAGIAITNVLSAAATVTTVGTGPLTSEQEAQLQEARNFALAARNNAAIAAFA